MVICKTRFWQRDGQSDVEILRFTRVPFGLALSPFLLGGVIDMHLSSWEDREPVIVAKLRRELYVDDLVSGSTANAKEKVTKMFRDGCFKLHKWHCNDRDLESDNQKEDDSTCARARLPRLPIADGDLRRRAKHLLRCKEAVWKRWSREYLRSLRERHRAKIKPGLVQKVGDVVTIANNEKKGEWTLEVVEELVTGKDNEVRVVKIRGSKSHMERAVQQLYLLELSCDVEQPIPPVVMNPQAPVFRPRRDAAVAARERVRELIQTEET